MISGMVKAVSFFKRKAGMSVDAFQAYWRTAHPEVVVKLPGIRRYVQSHTLPSAYRKGEPVYDGIAELWFDDTGAMRALAGTAAYAAVQADEARFIERSTMGLIITEEHVVKDGAEPPFVHRKEHPFSAGPWVRRPVGFGLPRAGGPRPPRAGRPAPAAPRPVTMPAQYDRCGGPSRRLGGGHARTAITDREGRARVHPLPPELGAVGQRQPCGRAQSRHDRPASCRGEPGPDRPRCH